MTRLPRRDWVILPLISLLSLVLVLGLSELAARLIWPEQLEDRCAVRDPLLGPRFRPDCRATVKGAETPWLEDSYNDCGLRTAEACGPKPRGDFRVAVIGSSIGSGYLVPYADTFAARASALLARRCRITVDFQNLAVPGTGLEQALARLDTALTLRPDMVLMALSAHDLEVLHGPSAPTADSPAAAGPGARLRALAVQLRASRAVLIAQHFLYNNLDTYLPLYLRHGDEADFLRPPLSVAWQRRLDRFEAEISTIAARTRTDGVPFMLIYVPLRAQAALLRWPHLPPGIDPALLGRGLGQMAARHAVDYLDLTEVIGGRADVTRLYYPVDSHPNSAGSAVIAKAVAGALLDQAPALAACREQLRPDGMQVLDDR